MMNTLLLARLAATVLSCLAVAPMAAQQYDIDERGAFSLRTVRAANGKYGFVGEAGKPRTPLIYDAVSNFSEDGTAPVMIEGRWGIIDTLGRTIVPVNYDYAAPIRNGYSIVQQGGQFGVVSASGQVTVPPAYTYIYPLMSKGGIFSAATGNRWGAIRGSDNTIVVPFKYAFTFVREDGSVEAFIGKRTDFYDAQGRQVLDSTYAKLELFENGFRIAERKDGNRCLMDPANAVVLPCEYTNIDYADYRAYFTASKDGKSGLYDAESRRWTLPLRFEGVGPVRAGRVVVGIDENTSAYYDVKGNQVFGRTFEEADAFNANIDNVNRIPSSLALAKANGKWGVIDTTGRTVIPFELKEREDVVWTYDGRIIGEKESGFGVTDLSGNILIPFKFHNWDRKPFIGWDQHDYFIVRELPSQRQTVVDRKGGFAIPAGRYAEIPYITRVVDTADKTVGHYATVKGEGGEYGVVHLESGRVVLPLEYDALEMQGSLPLRVEKARRRVSGRARSTASVIFLDGGRGVVSSAGADIKLYDHGTGLFIGEKATGTSSNPFGSQPALYALLDSTGRPLTAFEYDDMTYSRDGRFFVRKDEKIGFLDRRGRLAIPMQFDASFSTSSGGRLYHADGFRDGYASVRVGTKRVLIDTAGRRVVDSDRFRGDSGTTLAYVSLGQFNAFSATKRLNENESLHYLLLNDIIYDFPGGNIRSLSGERVTRELGDFTFGEGFLTLRKNGKFGYVDTKGREAIPFEFDDASNFSSGIAHVRKNGEYFAIDRTGKRLPMLTPTLSVLRSPPR